MAANNSYGFSNDGYRSSYTESTYSCTISTPSYPGRNMEDYSYCGDVKYPKESLNTQVMDYGDHSNHTESNRTYGVWEDNLTQQAAVKHGCQESNIYENMPPSSSYDHRQSYQDMEPQNQEYNHHMKERDSQNGPWNMPTWDMNQASSCSSCEPVAYPEASSNYQQQQPNRFGHGSWGCKESRTNGTGTKFARNAPYLKTHMKFKGQPKPQQLHYCDMCKISCAGYQTYKEHLEGQKHKKKELAVMTQVPMRGVHTKLHCQLCDISCTGPDAYSAHIKGAKHQKVVKLHIRLGKPIPDPEPVITHTCESSSKSLTSNSPGMQDLGNALSPEFLPESLPTASAVSSSSKQSSSMLEMEERHMDGRDMFYRNSVKPVGESYVEESHNKEGKTIRFHCKLCGCSFNDTNARDMHLKGRRHRLQYKKKVNPCISIEGKPSNRPWRIQEENIWRRWEHRQAMQRYLEEEQMWLMRRYEVMYWRELEEEFLFWEYQQMRRMHLEWSYMDRGRPPYRYNLPHVNESVDDQYIMRKHTQIYPTEKELQAIQKTVSLSERALKLVSDCIKHEYGDKDASKSGYACLLRGVKRVGILSKGLILRGNQHFQLTLLCSKKPTCSLLKRIAEVLPEQLEKLSKRQHTVTYDIEEAHLLITFTDEPRMQFTVFLTCNNMFAKNGEKKDVEKEEDVETGDLKKDTCKSEINFLSEEKCRESLTHLHKARWFQFHASNLQSCVIVIRIFRDLRQRVSAWRVLSDWAMELIVQTALSSSSVPLSPSEATARVLECIAFGVLLSDGPGLQDPCQEEKFDVFESLTNQEREDITANAQQALRMLSFRQIHKVLDMEPLQSTRQSRQNRKRAWHNSDCGLRERKKNKKEDVDNVQKPN